MGFPSNYTLFDLNTTLICIFQNSIVKSLNFLWETKKLADDMQ